MGNDKASSLSSKAGFQPARLFVQSHYQDEQTRMPVLLSQAGSLCHYRFGIRAKAKRRGQRTAPHATNLGFPPAIS